MSRIHIYLLGIIFLIIIMLMAGPVAGGNTKSTNGGLMVMPPSPELLERVERGEAELPAFITDPELRQSLGINQPGEKIQPTGAWRALALVVEFTDNASSTPATFFDTMLFGTGTGTVKDYFDEVSYGILDIVTVNLPSSTGWMTMPQTYAYYVGADQGSGPYPNNTKKLAEDAVAAADPSVDYSDYDNDGDGTVESLFIIHAGPGAESTGSANDIWSHQWSMQNPPTLDGVTFDKYTTEPELFSTPGDMTIGVYAHELAHAFGLPDLYDYEAVPDQGIGKWGMMAGGSWNGTPGGSSPAWFSAWSRAFLGFVTPTNLTANSFAVSIPAAETSPTVYRLWTDGIGGNEYFLVENRQPIGYDAELPGFGLLVWHIDDSKSSNELECSEVNNWDCGANHLWVALEQADGLFDLEKTSGGNAGDTGDPFPGSTNNHDFDFDTVPNSSSYNHSSDTCVGVENISGSAATMTADLTVTCPSAEPLVCNGPAAGFETGIPADWQVYDNTGGTGILWTTTAYSACAVANGTNGSGEAACADSDAAGSGAPPYDTELVSPAIDLTGQASASLYIRASYHDFNLGYNDRFEVDVWDGVSWTTEVSWDQSHQGTDINLDLSPYVGNPGVYVRFHYFGDGYDFSAQVDDVELNCVAPPIIDVDPPSLVSTLNVDESEFQLLTINNLGDAPLNWSIVEDDTSCDSPTDIPWLSIAPGAGTTPPLDSRTTDVTFDATGLSPGTYNANVCVNSDDPVTPLVAVPVTLDVELPPHTISGYVRTSGGAPIDGVVLSGLPGNPISRPGDGWYSAEVPDGWSGTVRPLSAGLAFTPTNRAYSNVTVNMANQNYTRTDPSGAAILLVDDDDNSPDVRATYIETLDALAVTYDIWDTANSDIEPDAAFLAAYDMVIWFSGAAFGAPATPVAGPGSAAEGALGNWLDGENCLFISSQDYHYDRTLTPFMNNYLGVESVTDDLGAYIDVTGQGSVFGGLGPYTLAYAFDDYSDIISPTLTAELAFLGDNGNGAAVAKDNGVYQTTFWGFPFEALSTGPERVEAMGALLNLCGTSTTPIIEVAPPSLTSTLPVDGAELQVLTINNLGDAPLNWSIDEDDTSCDSPTDIPWLSVVPDAGTTAPLGSSPTDVTFDATGLTPGAYNANLCAQSNDPVTPIVTVPVTLVVEPPPLTISGYVKTSGGVGISGVVMSGLPGNPSTAAGGFYSDTVPAGWSGTVQPFSAGQSFTPTNRAYSNVTADMANQDYTRTYPSGAQILLVDDDNNVPDVRSYYTATLDSLAVTYDVWDTAGSDIEPDAAFLAAYDKVIWFTGVAESLATGPGAAAETDLGAWLDDGNCFFISSQDYALAGQTPFMSSYLGLDSYGNDAGDFVSVSGQGSVFGGLGPYTLSYPSFDYSDTLTPDATAELAFLGNNGNEAAINKDNGVYRTTFWGFPFEALDTAANRVEALGAFLAWCQGGIPPVITHTPLTSAAAGLSLPLTATVTSTAPPLTVTLYYSSTGDTVYTGLLMANTGGDVYEATIPAGAVLAPTLNYYLEADDAISTTVEGPHQVTVLEVPPAPVPLSPSGVIADTTPTYSWQEVATATDYQLYLTDADGQFVYAEWVSAAVVCAAGTCSHAPTPVLDQADYKWNVRANNVAGNSPWSPAKTFTVFTGSAAPGPATLLAPDTTIADTTPTFSWQEVTEAIRYRVYLLDGDRQFVYGTIVQARNACSAGTCAYTMPTPLPDGDYRFFIRAENPLGGTWSAPMLFTLFTGSAAPGPATLVAPNGDIADSTPTYQWDEVAQAIKYKVYLIDDDRQFVYGTIVQAQNACIAGACSHTAPAPLPDGDYRFFIQAINPLGATWSAPMLFTLFTGSAVPGQATLLTPNGSIADSTPTYEWLEASDAIQYQVYLLDGGGLFVYGAYVQANNACSGGTCSLTPSTVLVPDDYRWFVQAINPLGTTWSVPMDYTLTP